MKAVIEMRDPDKPASQSRRAKPRRRPMKLSKAQMAMLTKLLGVAEKTAKSTVKVDIEALTIAAFGRKGIKGVQPRIDVLTYDAWIAKGLRPNQPSVRVKVPGAKGKGMALWHISQCSPDTGVQPKAVVLTTEEMVQSYLAKKASAEALNAEYGV